MFATAKLGAVFVPINFRLAAPEVTFLLADSGADVFVWSGHLSPLARAALMARACGCAPEWWSAASPPTARQTSNRCSQRRAAGARHRRGRKRRGLPHVYVGHHRAPKGAMLTHDNLLWNAINTLAWGTGSVRRDRTVTVASMFHIGGLGVHTLPLLYVGGTNAILPAFDPEKTLATMARERVTVQFLVPVMWAALMTVPGFDNLRPVGARAGRDRWCTVPVAGARILPGKGCAVQEGFGMTETAPAVTILDADHVKEKAGSIGRASSMWRLASSTRRIATCPSARWASSLFVARTCSWGTGGCPRRRRGVSRRLVPHRRHGPHGREGFITLVDRKKDMIITGGENVYPIEVEQVLYRHPAVREVAVVGVPHAKWGETPIAVVALKDGAQLTATI